MVLWMGVGMALCLPTKLDCSQFLSANALITASSLHEVQKNRIEFASAAFSGYGEGMTFDSIKEAISALPEDQRHSLAFWLNELEYDDWDRQMVRDFSPGGRGMALVAKVKREIAERNTVPLEEGLAQAKANREQSRQ